MALTKVTSGVRTLGTSEVATSNIATGAVTESKIANNSVSGQKIAMGSDAQGDILFRGASNYERLAKGTAGQKLQMNSSATAPEWVDDGYRAGEVIEEIALIQNGSSQTVLSGTYTAGNVTAAQELTTSYADVTGSSITYTPPSGATRVIYTLSLSATYSSTAIALSSFKTFLDSDEVTAARQTLGSSYLEAVHPLSWVFVIGGSADTATGQVASWSSGKTIKLQARENNGNPVKLHETINFDGVGDSTQLRVPIINIKAIK